MAIPIKAVPILSGEIADEFVQKAEEHAQNPAPGLSPEREERIAKVMKQMREFKFPWERRSWRIHSSLKRNVSWRERL